MNRILKKNRQKRYDNYRCLFDHVRESDMINKVCKNLCDVTSAPLYFTIFVKDRLDLQKILAEEAIYAPVIWPVEDERVLVDDEVKYIYDHLLAIPCDQRYDESDMRRAVEVINNVRPLKKG